MAEKNPYQNRRQQERENNESFSKQREKKIIQMELNGIEVAGM